jgi:hypothetical protein
MQVATNKREEMKLFRDIFIVKNDPSPLSPTMQLSCITLQSVAIFHDISTFFSGFQTWRKDAHTSLLSTPSVLEKTDV